MTIRKISVKRFEEYKNLRLNALKNHPESFSASYEEEANYSDEVFKERLSNPEHMTLGAFVDNQLVGMVKLVTYGRRKVKENGMIVSLFVLPEYRKQGIANKLIHRIIEKAKEKKVKNLFAHVTSTNYIAVNMFTRHKFVRYETHHERIIVDGNIYKTYGFGRYI